MHTMYVMYTGGQGYQLYSKRTNEERISIVASRFGYKRFRS